MFDGTQFCIGESINPDDDLEKLLDYNFNLEIMSEGYGVTRKELELLFINNIIRKTHKLTWFLFNSDEGQLAIDIIADDVNITNVNLEEND